MHSRFTLKPSEPFCNVFSAVIAPLALLVTDLVGCSVLTANPLSCTIPSTGGYPGLAVDNGFFDWRTEAASVESDVDTTIQELATLGESCTK